MRQFRLDFGKLSLIIGVGEYFYTTKTPPKGPETPTSFAMLMRKDIGGKFLDSFKQYKNDRIYVMEFSNGHKLILEQFAHGNLFLVDENNAIIRPYSFAPTSKKTYRAGDKYEYPDSPPANLLRNLDDWKIFSKANSTKAIGSALGRLSFGKIYVNNLLLTLGIERDLPVLDIDEKQAEKLILGRLKMQKEPKYLILRKDGGRELSLCELADCEIERSFDSFSEAVQYFVSLDEGKPISLESPAQIRLKKRLAEQKRALVLADKTIEQLISDANYIEKNMLSVDEKLIEARKKGEKKLIL